MKKVPYGKLITIVEICKNIAQKYGIKGCCSLTTGIFIMTAANAVVEAKQESLDLEIPYWRTLKANGYLNDKYPGGVESHKDLLEAEGFKVIRKSKKFYVQGYLDFLIQAF